MKFKLVCDGILHTEGTEIDHNFQNIAPPQPPVSMLFSLKLPTPGKYLCICINIDAGETGEELISVLA